MSIMSLVPGSGDERPAALIAGRIRGIMAEHLIPANRVAAAIGLTQPTFSRRYTGEVDWSVDELVKLAKAFGMTFAELCSVIEPDVTGDTEGEVPPGTTGG